MTPDWDYPDRFPRLRQEEVHVWRMSLDVCATPTAQLERLLSADEVQRADRFRFPLDRARFVLARARLRELLANYLDTSSERIEFQYGEHGKPRIAEPQDPIAFSLSHSHEMAIVAVACGQEIGVDLEWIGRRVDAQAIADRYYDPVEVSDLARAEGDEMLPHFLRLWTRKEAFAKLSGQGIWTALTAGNRTEESGSRSIESLLRRSGWFLEDLTPAPDYVGAVVTERYPELVRRYSFPVDLLRVS
jgi:4'-phosphopantetheinyl transferase